MHEDRVEQTICIFTGDTHEEIKAQSLISWLRPGLSTARGHINRIQVCVVTTTSAILAYEGVSSTC